MATLIVIDTGEGTPAWNMGCDVALLESALAGARQAVVRFYRWAPPAVSLGYFQDLSRHIDEDACREMGVALVRRPTGGKALLHLADLTYSVAVSPHHPLAARSIPDSYEAITLCLARSLTALGVPGVALGKARSGGAAGGVCFAEHLVESVLVGGKKMLGSAQVRRGGGFLQHGSLKLRFDPAREARVYRPVGSRDRAHWQALLERTVTSLDAHLSQVPSWDELTGALAGALVPLLGDGVEEGRLTVAESARADELAASVYADPSRKPTTAF